MTVIMTTRTDILSGHSFFSLSGSGYISVHLHFLFLLYYLLPYPPITPKLYYYIITILYYYFAGNTTSTGPQVRNETLC
jgi:hypothetical protein